MSVKLSNSPESATKILVWDSAKNKYIFFFNLTRKTPTSLAHSIEEVKIIKCNEVVHVVKLIYILYFNVIHCEY